jgi:cardiolipin synthase
MAIRLWKIARPPAALGPAELRHALRYVRKARGLREGNRLLLLHGGGAVFGSMLEAIAGARSHVHLETYILRADRTGKRFQAALIERARAGLEVRLLYDSLGSFGLDSDFVRELEKEGVEVVEFRPIAPWRRGWGLNRRDHQKILVVDDRIGFTGGINIGDEYAPPPDGGGWHDLQARIEGPVVVDLARAFRRAWLLGGGRRFPEPPDREPEPKPGFQALAREIDNFGMRQRSRMHAAWRQAVNRAERSAHVMIAYFVPDRLMRRALRRAARRGVDVRVIVPGASDVWMVLYASRYIYASLLRGGVRIFEFPRKMMHAKAGVVDGIWSTIGSYNIDSRSFFHNLEVGLVILDPDFAAQVERVFEQDLAQCREILLEEWNRRGLWERTKEWLCHLFRYWL